MFKSERDNPEMMLSSQAEGSRGRVGSLCSVVSTMDNSPAATAPGERGLAGGAAGWARKSPCRPAAAEDALADKPKVQPRGRMDRRCCSRGRIVSCDSEASFERVWWWPSSWPRMDWPMRLLPALRGMAVKVDPMGSESVLSWTW